MNSAEKYRIISIDGSKLYRKTHLVVYGDNDDLSIRDSEGGIDHTMFSGYLNRSLDLEKLLEVYDLRKEKFDHRTEYNKIMKPTKKCQVPIMPLLVDLSFDFACKEFEKIPSDAGTKYIRYGYELTAGDWEDHCAFKTTIDGKRILAGIEIADEKTSKVVDNPNEVVVEEIEEDKDESSGDAENKEDKTKKKKRKKLKKKYLKVANNQLENSTDILVNKYFQYSKDAYRMKKGEVSNAKGKWKDTESGNSKDHSLTTENIRDFYYKYGFTVDGVKFVRYKRSAGSSRSGHCMFIAEPLLDGMMEWTSCGLEKPKETPKLVSWEAYIALTLSDMKWPLEIKRNEILIMQDQKRTVTEPVICVSKTQKEEKGKITTSLTADEKECTISNTIWDGEGLLDASCFEQLAKDYPHKDGSGKVHPDNRFEECSMVLLRNRFFKTCAFKTKLKEWFADNNITDVKQLNGYTEAKNVFDIKLIVTESSIKYFKLAKKIRGNKSEKEKFEINSKKYLEALYNGREVPLFGIVKTEKPTHHMDGDMVQTSYQILSTLGFSEEQTKELYKPSIEYLDKIKSNPMYMRYYLNSIIDDVSEDSIKSNQAEGLDEFEDDIEQEEREDEVENADFENDLGDDGEEQIDSFVMKAIIDTLTYSDDFAYTAYYKRFRDQIRNTFRDKIRKGHILVDGTYATLFGNGAELLYAAINKDFDADRSQFLNGSQIYTKKFAKGTKLLCARSPHITMGNLLVSENTACEIYDKYFDLSNEIVCVNAIGHNIQHRLNGCDYDSDTMLITDNKLMVEVAAEKYNEFLVPYNAIDEIESSTESRRETKKTETIIDVKIANNRIGEIVNLSQLYNAKYWDTVGKNSKEAKELYKDICILAVMSNTEIDKAKRDYGVETAAELERLRDKIKKSFVVDNKEKATGTDPKEKDTKKYKKPKFFAYITSGKTADTDDVHMATTMSYVYYGCVMKTEECPEGWLTGLSYESTKKVSEIVDADKLAKPQGNEYDYEKEVCKAVSDYSNKCKEINRKIRLCSKETADKLRADKQEALSNCFKIVNKRLGKAPCSDGVLRLLIKDLDEASKNKETGEEKEPTEKKEASKNKKENKKNNDVSKYGLSLFAFIVRASDGRFLKHVVKSKNTLKNLKRDEHGTEEIYGYKYKVENAKRPEVKTDETSKKTGK